MRVFFLEKPAIGEYFTLEELMLSLSYILGNHNFVDIFRVFSVCLSVIASCVNPRNHFWSFFNGSVNSVLIKSVFKECLF